MRAFTVVLLIWMSSAASAQTGDEERLLAGFDLMYSECVGWLRLGMTGEQLRERLSSPLADEPVFLAATGLWSQSWKYPGEGILLEMEISEEGSDTLVGVVYVFEPCSLTTLRGIGVGSTRQEVEAAYGDLMDPCSTPGTFVAGTVYGGLIFGIEEGRVTSIFLGAAAE